MADAREMFYPVEIQRDYQGMMRILWDDGHECLYPYSDLRKVCPCATCRELRGQQQQAPAASFTNVGSWPSRRIVGTPKMLCGSLASS